ncbi:sigma factor-like helix-turn-helix DNA-binding protein [Halospina sp. K52047b]|uniref:sigma factor-like helix-turn-helix DNA-binding protein n=1 Tax=Halospina sp. K52047b TaxID=2614160 RepID=UPI001249F2E6|nr:sigma factor-like helix-turn-helix DNA-binding protein [Halospina sp. K52047b]KAA8981192.1 hypothetical protein F3089_09765 [Halospina sp. K52047b]
MNIQYFDMPLLEVESFNGHRKVMQRLAFGVREGYIGRGQETTVAEILELEESELRKIPYFGTKYFELFSKMKDDFESSTSIGPHKGENLECEDFDELYNLSLRVYLNLMNLEEGDLKALKKLESKGLGTSVSSLITLNQKELVQVDGIGEAAISGALNIKKLCVSELVKALRGEVDLEGFKSSVLLPSKVDGLTIEALDSLLIEDLDAFIKNLSSNEEFIFVRRWGFTEEKETLQEIGNCLNLTRERVRQIEKGLKDKFRSEKRLTGGMIASIVESNMRCLST